MICPRCKFEKELTEFGSNKSRQNGLQGWCKVCSNSFSRSWYKKNPEKALALSEKSFHKFYASLNGKCVHMLNNARSRSRVLGVRFTLTRDWICEVVVWIYNRAKGAFPVEDLMLMAESLVKDVPECHVY